MSRGAGVRPGKQYVVTDEGTVEEVAAQAYGDTSKASLIWGANQLTSGTVSRGQTLIIPGEAPADRLVGKEPDDLTVLVAGVELKLESARIVRTMDTGADGWSGRIEWNPGADANLDRVTRPYGYERAAAYLGNVLQVSGLLYQTLPELTDKGNIKELVGYSFTADAVDSHVPPPYERQNVTLEQLADELTKPLGIKAVFKESGGGPFARVTAHESDTIFSHLSKLATERGLLVSCTEQGDLLFHRALVEGKPVGTLEEGGQIVTQWKADYDGRKRFHTYKCIQSGSSTAIPIWGVSDSTNTGPSTVTATDPAVPRSRILTFRADDTTPGNITDAARWRKNKQIVDALTQELPVADWYAPNGELWSVNTLITVVSPTLGVPKGYNFLIRAVEFILEERRSAVLHLVPPLAYSRNKDLGDVWSL